MSAREDHASEPSPYVRLYLPRKQAEEVRRVVLWHAEGHAKSNPLWAALKNIDKALDSSGSRDRT